MRDERSRQTGARRRGRTRGVLLICRRPDVDEAAAWKRPDRIERHSRNGPRTNSVIFMFCFMIIVFEVDIHIRRYTNKRYIAQKTYEQ